MTRPEAGKELILTFDVGTTSVKTCVYAVEDHFRLIASARGEYDLKVLENGGVEQDPDDWFRAMIRSAGEIWAAGKAEPSRIAGISFCSQMQGLVLTDGEGKALRPAMSYMDGRSGKQKREAGSLAGHRFQGPRIEGLPVHKLIRSIHETGIAPTSVKDPLWRYHWVRNNEPEIFARIDKWLDVKEYLIRQLTGRAVMTRDSACSTFLYDNRFGKHRWSEKLCRLYGVNREHLPPVIDAWEEAGQLIPGAAEALGLAPGVPVFGGGGDASLIGLGAGCTGSGDAHIYLGTSAWVSAVSSKRKLDLKQMIGSITCALPEKYHYFCEQETGGKCMEWVRDHLALDEIGVYLESRPVSDDPDSEYKNLFEYLNEVVSATPAGSGGVIFTPWLHGSRSPFEDPLARGMFFNLGLTTGKRQMIRAVVEGLAFNLRWMIEAVERKHSCGRKLRFVGGGALSTVTAQILADITGRTLEVPDNPQNAGALGAAAVAAVGLQWIESFDDVPRRISVERVFFPFDENERVYERNYRVFRNLYRDNRKNFTGLNQTA